MSQQSLWQRWKKTSLPNKLMVTSTFIMAIATICLAVAAIFQYLAVREQSDTMQKQLNAFKESSNQTTNQTNDLIAATKDTANASQDVARQNGELVSAAQKQANASVTQANASQTQAGASVAQVGVAKQSLGAAQTAANAAERNAEISKEALRPFVGFFADMETFAAGQPIVLRLTIRNEGNSPATVAGVTKFILSEGKTVTYNFTNGTPFGPVQVLPHQQRVLRSSSKAEGIVLTAEDVQRFDQDKLHLLFSGLSSINGVGGIYQSEFAMCYIYELKTFGDCVPGGKR